MKITFCTYDASNFVSGTNSWLKTLLPGLREIGIESEVLFFTPEDANTCPCFITLNQQNFACYAFPWQSTTQQKIRWILTHLRENTPDVFVPNFILGALYAGRLVKQAGIPTIGVLHSDEDFYQGLLRQFVFGQKSYQLSALVCVSEFLMQTVKAQGEPEVFLERIPCGVELPEQLVEKNSAKLRLIYTGRLVEQQKQISKVTSALCRVVKEVPNTEAVIYGDGPARSTVQSIIATEGEGLPVQFGGSFDSTHIQAILADAHVLVLLSDYEGLPVSLLEAMAYGLVPICLNIRSGIPELVKHNLTGLLVEDRSEKFVEAIRRLTIEPDLWATLSQNARSQIETRYSNAVCVAAWKELLLTVTQNAKAKQPIVNPLRLELPTPDPAFKAFDRRQNWRVEKTVNRLRNKISQFKQKIALL
jgi:colanic acid/amylovoran biosynthesis glycosyltransferase